MNPIAFVCFLATLLLAATPASAQNVNLRDRRCPECRCDTYRRIDGSMCCCPFCSKHKSHYKAGDGCATCKWEAEKRKQDELEKKRARLAKEAEEERDRLAKIEAEDAEQAKAKLARDAKKEQDRQRRRGEYARRELEHLEKQRNREAARKDADAWPDSIDTPEDSLDVDARDDSFPGASPVDILRPDRIQLAPRRESPNERVDRTFRDLLDQSSSRQYTQVRDLLNLSQALGATEQDAGNSSLFDAYGVRLKLNLFECEMKDLSLIASDGPWTAGLKLDSGGISGVSASRKIGLFQGSIDQDGTTKLGVKTSPKWEIDRTGGGDLIYGALSVGVEVDQNGRVVLKGRPEVGIGEGVVVDGKSAGISFTAGPNLECPGTLEVYLKKK